MNSSGAIPKNNGGARPKINKRSSLTLGSNDRKDKIINDSIHRASGENNDRINKYCNDKEILRDGQSSVSGAGLVMDCPLLPLEQKYIFISEEGVQAKRPALHSAWAVTRVYMNYTPPPYPDNSEDFVAGAVDAWVEQMEYLHEDLIWLLNLPHHKFWCQMIYDRSVRGCLESYLMGGPRWFDETPDDDQCQTIINSIHQLVFLIYLRMATYKESKNDFITPSVFGDIVYDNFLYDICNILDLCVLYGPTNGSLLKKIIENIFTYQPKYFDDLQNSISSLKQVMDNLESKLQLHPRITLNSEPLAGEVSCEELEDIVQYIMDIFCSLEALLAIFPKAAETFHEKDFESRLCSFYERVVPILIENISSLLNNPEGSLWTENLLKKIRIVRVSALAVFRQIFATSCLSSSDPTEDQILDSCRKKAETFIQTLTSCAEDKIFIADYSAAYSIDDDIRHFQSTGYDMTSLNFVRDAVESAAAEMRLSSKVETLELENSDVLEETDRPVPSVEKVAADVSGMNGYYEGETQSLSQVEIDSLISGVQDLLPYLGSGFIKECLKFYNYSSEEVLNAVLEGNLPPCLNELDKSAVISEKVTLNGVSNSESEIPVQKEALKTERGSGRSSILDSRANVYDNDEFDIFRQPTAGFDRTKVHKGKRNVDPDLEKDHILEQKIKSIGHQYDSNQGYSIYEDEEKYIPFQSQDYDDEYDDTYDTNETGDIDNFSTDRKTVIVMPSIRGKGALNVRGLSFVPKDQEDKGEEEEGGSANVEISEGQKGRSEMAEEIKDERDSLKKANASYRRGFKPSKKDNYTASTKFQNRTKKSENAGQELTVGDAESRLFDRSNNSGYSADSNAGSWSKQSSEQFDGRAAEGETRRRMKRNEMKFQYKSNATSHEDFKNSTETTSEHPRNSFFSSSVKPSGKTWRNRSDDSNSDNRGYRGGKYKEDTNHGKRQDQKYKHKMVHKNDQRRDGAQAKYRNNL